ncbi:MAG: cyclic nucleotide-binding protein [Gammaproteobacteria bacterium]|nr:MAG: cyclic nucleotide-binding protein [Gammaproteobacteria bacterium]
MKQDHHKLSASELKRYRPLDKLSEEQLILLASRAQVKRFRKKSLVLERGSDDGFDYFLLDGTLTLEAVDGRRGQMDNHSPAAKNAIAHLRPRQYNVLAKTDAEFMVVPDKVLNQLIKDAPVEQSGKGQYYQEENDTSYQLLMDIQADLKNNQFKLPSLPDIAYRIKLLVDKDATTADDIAKLVSADPAIVVKLVKACNSPLYRGAVEVGSAKESVVRLGMATTRQLVTIFSMRELFKSKRKELQSAMDELWLHSREVAAIAYVLAETTPGLNKDYALLAGLIHDIGAIPVIAYAEGYVDLWADAKNLKDAIKDLKAEVGESILSHWGFKEDLIEVINEADNWHYESGEDDANYADLVIVSQMHCLIGKPGQKKLPQFNKIPAFNKLAKGGLTPQKSLKVLVDARQKIDEVLALLETG